MPDLVTMALRLTGEGWGLGCRVERGVVGERGGGELMGWRSNASRGQLCPSWKAVRDYLLERPASGSPIALESFPR